MPRMVYTIGADGLRMERLIRIVEGLGLTIVDMRRADEEEPGAPNCESLVAEFGRSYVTWPSLGRGGDCDLERLLDYCPVLILAAARAPGDCRRHTDLAKRLLDQDGADAVDCLHFCGPELVAASELERALVEGTDYECCKLPEDLR